MTAVDDLATLAASDRTPRRIFLERTARERIEHIAASCEALGKPPVSVLAAYSVKTNPRAELLAMTRAKGFFAETISNDERAWVSRNGFDAARTIANGPEPIVPAAHGEVLAMAFADSIEALARNRAARTATVCGIRLRPSMVASRFGVPVEDDPELIATVSSLPLETPLGVSFHARREDFKGASWRDVAADVLERARVLERDSGRKITVFDVGGGWTPDEFHGNFAPDMRWLVDRVAATLPACRTLVAEPGQALCTPTEAIMTTIVEVRERRGRREAILDVGYSDWPQMQAYSHRMFAWREESWRALGRGPDQLGGRTCLEYDAVHGVRLPLDVAAGDRLLIADTGSYDHAMAFDFARGHSDGTTPYD